MHARLIIEVIYFVLHIVYNNKLIICRHTIIFLFLTNVKKMDTLTEDHQLRQHYNL